MSFYVVTLERWQVIVIIVMFALPLTVISVTEAINDIKAIRRKRKP